MKCKFIAGLAGAALTALAAGPSYSAILSYTPEADITSAPYTIDLTPGSTLTFDSNTSDFASTIGVSTSGTTEIFSQLGSPAYFQPFATTNFPSDQLGSFQADPTSTAIPYSYSEGTLGFEFSEADGTHYGIANIGGDLVDAYFVNTVAGEDVNLATTVSAAPEPSAWALMIAGVAMIGATVRFRRRRGPVTASIA